MAMCYPDTTDWSCALTDTEIAGLDPAKKARAEALAWSSLQRLTGFRLALCPIVIRPCAARCTPSVWVEAPVTGFPGDGPFIRGGQWFNSCGCQSSSTCDCGFAQEIILPAQEVSGPIVVKVNGGTLAPTAYRVDNGNRLIRTDGGTWPLCQDPTLPDDAEGTMTVSYYPGIAADELLSFAAGILAVEWYKACDGKACRLPDGATRVTRQGITFEVPSDMFTGGLSGIREVDNIVGQYNPFRLTMPSSVFSPDAGRRGRVRTY